MSDKKKIQFRLSLSVLRLIIIDEISMVSNITLIHIHQRLKEIFGSFSSQLFAGISVITVGDLYQLPPIKRKPVFEDYKDNKRNLYHPWQVFTIIELTQIMRQKDDKEFTELLNRFRTGSYTDEDINFTNARLISPSADNYPLDALHSWAENDPVDEHNSKQLEQLQTPLFELTADDQYPPNVAKQDSNTVLSRSRSDLGGLDFQIKVKEGARVMLTTNVDIADRLINGQMGTVLKIHVNKVTQKPSVIYIKFDDKKAGTTFIQARGTINGAVPIESVLSKIRVHPFNHLLQKYKEFSFLSL